MKNLSHFPKTGICIGNVHGLADALMNGQSVGWDELHACEAIRGDRVGWPG
jgi:hypothetical protein